MLEKCFKLKEHNTTVKQEVIAGLTTFLTMAYILAVNPNILSASGMSANAVFVATAIASAIATFLMAFLANYPIGLSAGIGLFVAFIGMQNAGIIVANDATIVGLGSFTDLNMDLALIGLVIICALVYFKVTGGVLIGIILTWVIGMILQGVGVYEGANLFPDFSNGLQLGAISQTAFKLNFGWAASHFIQFVAITFSFLYVDLFDTVGTVVGVADKANLLDKDGNLPRVGKVFFADAVGTTCGSLLGTSTITSFVESSAGVAAGGRTGLTAFTTGVMFLVALVLSPIFLAIPSFATAPALIYVGMLMVFSITKVKFDDGDIADSIGAYLALVMMPLSYSIATGIMFAILGWVILKVVEGKVKEISPVMWIVFVLFVLRIAALVTNFQ